MYVRMCVFIFYLLISCWCVKSAPSNPPATLTEEIIHCQYWLTSDAAMEHAHMYTHTHRHSHIALIVRTVTLKCTHTWISAPSITPCFTTQHPLTLPICWVHMHADVQSHTHTHNRCYTSYISIQGVLHCLSVHDTHDWWPTVTERPLLLIAYGTPTLEGTHATNTHEYNIHNMHNLPFIRVWV